MSEEQEKTHAKLSPSSSPRWMNCAGSIEVNSRGSGRISHYADEGTAAHNLLDICMRLDVDPEKFLGKCMYKHYEVTEDMCEAVGLAIDWINSYLARNPKAKLFLDKEVDPFAALKTHKGHASGTLDVGLDNAPEELVILDYKHGAGIIVEVMGNTQLLQYTLGYFSQYATRPYKRYRQVIIQPRGRHEEGPVREEVITHEQLLAYAEKLRKRIKEIAKNPNERVAGKWCTFCAGAGRCKENAEFNLKTAAIEFGSLKPPIDPQELDQEELDYALTRLPLLEKWMKAVMAAGLEYCMKGGELENHKLVHGRSTRFWSDENSVIEILDKGGFEADDYAPRKLIGVQKVVGLIKRRIADKGIKKRAKKRAMLDKAWKRFQPLVQHSRPEIHIAPKSDPREVVKRGEEFLEAPMEGIDERPRRTRSRSTKVRRRRN